METESYAPKSIKKDDLIQGLKATIEELKNEDSIILQRRSP